MQALAISVGEEYYPILTLPGRPKAILDRTAAKIYETETRIVNRTVMRNKERFPSDFYFELTSEETKLLSEVTNWHLAWNGGFAPKAFTVKGMNMLSTLLRSEVAVKRSVDIIRAFTELENIYSRDDKWDIITAKIIAAINNRLEDVRLSVNKKIISIEDRIAHIEQETSMQSYEQSINNNRIEEVNTCILELKNDLNKMRSEYSKTIVDKIEMDVENILDFGKLSDRQIKILDHIKQNENITNRECREMFNISNATAKRELVNLVDRRILEMKGKGRGTFYIKATRF